MKIQELFEKTSEEDKKVRDFIKKYRTGDLPKWNFKDPFPIHKVRDGKIYAEDKPLKMTNGLVNSEGKLTVTLDGRFGQIRVYSQKLKSFEGFPPRVSTFGAKDETRYCLIFGRANELLTSLEHCPREYSGSVDFSNLKNLSYKDVHKHIKWLNGFVKIHSGYMGPLLGVLKIEKFMGIILDASTQSRELYNAINIINKHLKEGRNIIACQKELYDNDLDEYAEL